MRGYREALTMIEAVRVKMDIPYNSLQGLQAYANSHINMRKSTPICEKSEKYAK